MMLRQVGQLQVLASALAEPGARLEFSCFTDYSYSKHFIVTLFPLKSRMGGTFDLCLAQAPNIIRRWRRNLNLSYHVIAERFYLQIIPSMAPVSEYLGNRASNAIPLVSSVYLP